MAFGNEALGHDIEEDVEEYVIQDTATRLYLYSDRDGGYAWEQFGSQASAFPKHVADAMARKHCVTYTLIDVRNVSL